MTTPNFPPAVLLSKDEARRLSTPPNPALSVYAVRGQWKVPAGITAYPVTQAAFAGLLGVPVATVREWEQGRRKPDAAATRLLALFAAAPEEMKTALAKLVAHLPESAAVP